MLEINLHDSNQKVHFIGIGGISMSGLAQIMHDNGFIVTGSDATASKTTRLLQELEIEVYPSHSPSNISEDTDIVVYTAAIASDNAELIEAKKKVKYVVDRAQFLGLLMKAYEVPICVSGTHGKTTTTSMLSEALLSTGFDPTITVGGILDSIGGNIHLGSSKYFLTEACEYCNSFLNFFPKIGIILNIEEDHMDFFSGINAIRDSFSKFSHLIPEDGFLAINGDIPDQDALLKETSCTVETFGLDPSYDWSATNISYDDKSCASFNVIYKGKDLGRIRVGAPGEHNIFNALSVCAVCHFIGIEIQAISESTSKFVGAKQRFEVKGEICGVTLVDDYAHHPTEIAATLKTAKNYPHNDLYVIFQPHTYTRTKAFLDEFANVLSKAPHVIITDIYAAREKDPGDIHAKDIVSRIDQSSCDVVYIEDFNEIADHLLISCKPGDLVVSLSAGTLNQVIDILLGE